MFPSAETDLADEWSGIGELTQAELQQLLAERDQLFADEPWPDPAQALAEALESDPLAEVGYFGRAMAMFQGAQLTTIAGYVNAALAAAKADPESDWHDPARPPKVTPRAVLSAEAEVALVLGVASVTAAKWIDSALRLAERTPASLAAVTDGTITLPKARALLDETENLPLDAAAEVEADLLPTAPQRTPGNLRRAARKAVMALDPDAATKRREKARAQRDVSCYPVEDGMARLDAYLTGEDAISVFGVIDTLAHANRDAGDERPIGALRADALVDLVLNPGGQANRIQHIVHVTITAETLLGLRAAPGDLHGYGPIPAQVAREIAGDATWQALFSDAITLVNTRRAPDAKVSSPVIPTARTASADNGDQASATRTDADTDTSPATAPTPSPPAPPPTATSLRPSSPPQ